MRRRITIAILGVVIGTLVLTVVGSLLLVRRAGISTAENELTTEAQAIGGLMSSYPVFTDTKVVGVLRRVGAFDHLRIVGLSPVGSVHDVPAPVVARLMNVAALQSGEAVAGNVGHVVFVAQPLVLSLTQRQALHDGLPPSDVRVLVVTRHVANPVNGVDYFILVAAVVLLAGIAVAAVLARRISAPIERAVGATRQIAGGNLDATVPINPREYPELADLATAINTLGVNLSRAQGLEREFLLSVSHELRTPLTSIRGYADAIADGATDDVAGALSIIGSEARRLERLVEDLLDLARLQARQFSLHTQRIDGAAVARSVAEGFQPEAASVGVELVAPTTPHAPLWADADPDRVGQVIANLIENALEVRGHAGRGRRARRRRLDRVVGVRRRPRGQRDRPAAHLRTALQLRPRPRTQGRSRAGPRHRGRIGLGHGRGGRCAVTGGRRARCPHGALAASPSGSGPGRAHLRRVTVGRSDASAPPIPPGIGGALWASVPVAALRLPTVEPQPRRSARLRIGRLRTRRRR